MMGIVMLAFAGFAANTAALQPSAPPRLIAGSLSDRDYPAAAAGARGSVRVNLTVGTNGRVTFCSIGQSSGNAALDQATCPLLTARYRYRPATRNGQPVIGNASTNVRWVPPR